MEELEALNLLLRAIGSDPVNSVSTQQPDAANALDTLNRYRKKAQKRGWWFNIQYKVVFQVVGGEIRIPKEYTTVVFDDTTLVKRGTRLFDKVNNTYQMTENKTAARTIYTTVWDEMPTSMQEYVAYAAAASFIRDEIEDSQKSQEFQVEAGLSMLDLKKEDLEQGQYNSFNKSRVVAARRGVRPYHLNITK
tara:strand:+ start:14 stop:589 length:576 start_codon:yes stop_codon:yes gene_type:complete